jgi:hypothetical protein
MCVAPPPTVHCTTYWNNLKKTLRENCFGMVVDSLKYLFREFIIYSLLSYPPFTFCTLFSTVLHLRQISAKSRVL